MWWGEADEGWGLGSCRRRAGAFVQAEVCAKCDSEGQGIADGPRLGPARLAERCPLGPGVAQERNRNGERRELPCQPCQLSVWKFPGQPHRVPAASLPPVQRGPPRGHLMLRVSKAGRPPGRWGGGDAVIAPPGSWRCAASEGAERVAEPWGRVSLVRETEGR